ncbi:hypothetical protein TH66_01140 [Carbonactinospora thermoautotrophica]|uniref:Solute-binding protein family 3/N-terminal domain-containing protein n=1 Tax=Carbonactinospora thermoautotrophica TaxID=1469144 RepID=A0A132NHT4_9ACTN|nr:ABC transporter substrate-binding protein [Carbonactinospora thermoautotrophica]KWX05687.1 hypothetical protein TH66_01140 [Carbonactinospora thermoautotrophica]KWX09701.1 hypothetical protein TR74_08000 [Carbonactinospora thermoautotrophica]
MRLRQVSRVAAVGTLLAALLTACSGGSLDAARGGLEKSRIKVGMLPVTDSAPYRIAIEKDLFKEQGLTVETLPVTGGAQATEGLVAGDYDVAFSDYGSFFTAIEKGSPLRILADGYEGRTGTMQILVKGDSPIKRPSDLAGKKIALNGTRNILQLLTEQALVNHGVRAGNAKYVEIPFPDMIAALEQGRVDAIFAVEPFVSQAKKQVGARPVLEPLSGPTASFPIAGYITTTDFVKKYPKTAAAFQRAMREAQEMAEDRKTVEEVLPAHAKIPPETAALVTLGTYPTTLNPDRLQRVPNLMQQFGYLKKHIDVPTLIQAPSN